MPVQCGQMEWVYPDKAFVFISVQLTLFLDCKHSPEVVRELITLLVEIYMKVIVR